MSIPGTSVEWHGFRLISGVAIGVIWYLGSVCRLCTCWQWVQTIHYEFNGMVFWFDSHLMSDYLNHFCWTIFSVSHPRTQFVVTAYLPNNISWKKSKCLSKRWLTSLIFPCNVKIQRHSNPQISNAQPPKIGIHGHSGRFRGPIQ